MLQISKVLEEENIVFLLENLRTRKENKGDQREVLMIFLSKRRGQESIQFILFMRPQNHSVFGHTHKTPI